MYAVASTCGPNHSISEKYETFQLLKLHFLQNSPLTYLLHGAESFLRS